MHRSYFYKTLTFIRHKTFKLYIIFFFLSIDHSAFQYDQKMCDEEKSNVRHNQKVRRKQENILEL